MSDTLVIRLPDGNRSNAEWIIVGASEAGAAVTPVSGSLAEAAEVAVNRRLVVLVPAGQVLRINVLIPLKGKSRIRQALPFALEEQLAGDIESQHFAFTSKNASGRTPVGVVEKLRLQDWMAQLAEVGLTANAIYAESDAVPAQPATMTIVLEGQQALIRSASGELTATDETSLDTMLELLLDNQAELLQNDATVAPISLLVYCNEEQHQRHATLWDRQRMRVENLDVKILPDGALPLLANQISSGGGVNLLQGEFAPKTELPVEWRNWRIAAALLAGFVVVNLVYKGAQLWQLSRADSALDAAAAEVLTRTFPTAGESSDPWRELRSRLGTAEDSGGPLSQVGFAEALEILSVAFAQTPGIRMETLNFRGGELDLQLIAPDVAALDRLRQIISDPGQFSAEIQSANPDEEVIKGRIQITAAAES